MINYYEELKIDPNATQEELEKKFETLRNSYRRKLENGSEQKVLEANKQLKILEEAKEILLDPELRKNYDGQIIAEPKSEPKSEPKPEQKPEQKPGIKEIQVPDIPLEPFEINRPEFYFTNDYEKLWKLYLQYQKNKDEDNERHCFRKLILLHKNENKVKKQLAENDFNGSKYKGLGWFSIIAVLFIWIIIIPAILLKFR